MRYQSPIHEIAGSIRRVGLSATCQLIWARLYDKQFDRKYNLDTAKRMELDELEVETEAASRGQMYQPTGVLAFRKIMQRITFPPDGAFVDYGCGKARTLILASMQPFKRVVGIEFSRELCDIAEKNVDQFMKSAGVKNRPEIICSDVVEYTYQDDESVFYFFYPFDAKVMSTVMGAIEASLQRNPRESVLVYYYAIHRDVVDQSPVFDLEKEMQIFGYTCLIYRHRIS